MDELIAFVQGESPRLGVSRTVIIGLAAVIVFLFSVGTLLIVSAATDPIRRRLGMLSPAGNLSDPGSWSRFTERFRSAANHVLPGEGAERSKIQRQLIHAGFRSSDALAYFFGIKTSLAVILGVSVLAAARWLPQFSTNEILLGAMAGAALGMMAPNVVLQRLLESRQRKLRNGFPDALDMLVICVEAGLGLSAAIQRVADELRFSHPELSAELTLVSAEARAGVEREVALRNLTERTGLDDVRGLVSLLVQTLRFGNSVADTLRVYSEELRDKRMQKAEEAAAKIGTKLIFPLVFCMFPSFFLVAIGPAVLGLVAVFSQMGTSP